VTQFLDRHNTVLRNAASYLQGLGFDLGADSGYPNQLYPLLHGAESFFRN